MVRACDLQEALTLLHREQLTPYAGGTDLMPQDRPDQDYLFIGQLPELRQIRDNGQYLRIGAAVTFREALASPLVPSLMKEAVAGIGAPAVRNAGTFGGNIANGSAKADSLLIDFAARAQLVIASVRGQRVAAVEEVFVARQQVALAPDELIVEILLPNRGLDNYYYQKVGGATALAISRVSLAAVIAWEDERIARLSVVFGALSDRVQRCSELEAALVGQNRAEAAALKEELLEGCCAALEVLPDRTGIAYRRTVAERLLGDFFRSQGL